MPELPYCNGSKKAILSNSQLQVDSGLWQAVYLVEIF